MPVQLRPMTAALACVLALGLAPAAVAQTAAPPAPGEVVAPSDATLEAFVIAALEVERIETGFRDRVAEAQSEEDRAALVEQANGEMVAAVEETPGIDVETYVGIMQQAQQDPALTERLVAMIEDARTE